MATQYRTIFFDLDHTLWDFETNARETLYEIFWQYDLFGLGIESEDAFRVAYTYINNELWAMYRENKIDKATLRTGRFARTLARFGISNSRLAEEIGEYYIYHSPRKTNLFEHCHETLTYLQGKYQLHIITNGFDEVQDIKLTRSQLKQYFEHVITSEKAGVKKPAKEIFLHAMKAAGSKRKESLMVGDNLDVDCVGARRVGMDQVYFNPHKAAYNEKVTYEVQSLRELRNFL